MKTKQTYTLDLTNLEPNSNFSCPHCGNTINLEDPNEEDYTILETKLNSNLEETVISCNKCANILYLTSNSSTQKTHTETEENEECTIYVAHI